MNEKQLNIYLQQQKIMEKALFSIKEIIYIISTNIEEENIETADGYDNVFYQGYNKCREDILYLFKDIGTPIIVEDDKGK